MPDSSLERSSRSVEEAQEDLSALLDAAEVALDLLRTTSRTLRRPNLAKLRMPWSGLRSSCDMLARNSDLSCENCSASW